MHDLPVPAVHTPYRPSDLVGVWQLQRRLIDRRVGAVGHVTGWLELTLAGSVVHWREQGELLWDGGRFEVTRELYVIAEDDGWMMHFADGRAFHPWRPDEVVEHLCGADLYRGLIVVDPLRTRLRVLWDVIGPEKDQRIFTRCRRRPETRPLQTG